MPTPPDAPQSFCALGHALVDQLADHLERIAGAPGPCRSCPRPDPALSSPDSTTTSPAADPLALWAAVVAHSHHVHHPRSVGHQVSAPVPVAALSLTALLAMRQVQAGHDLWRDGQAPDERFAVLVGAQTHYCVARGPGPIA